MSNRDPWGHGAVPGMTGMTGMTGGSTMVNVRQGDAEIERWNQCLEAQCRLSRGRFLYQLIPGVVDNPN